MKADGLSLYEILHYGSLGEIEGLHPDVANRIHALGADTQRVESAEQEAKENLDRLFTKLTGEVRPKLLDKLKDEYLNDH